MDGMTRKSGRNCRVRHCGRYATTDLPLPDGTTLDVGVCPDHERLLAADPGGWRLTSEPVDKNYGSRYRIVIEQMESAA